MRRYRDPRSAADNGHYRAAGARVDAINDARVAAFDEPTKRELREQIAEAVRNTAAMQAKGRK